jgi:hypothetical protein
VIGQAGLGRVTKALGLGLLLAGCSASRIENGTFYSTKGYQVGVPRDGWLVQPGARVDLELKRVTPPGGMLVDASCGDAGLERPIAVLARHLTFGLTKRMTVENDIWTVGGRPAAHSVIQGERDGAEVAVEAVVLKGERCVHDFLYVAPVGRFEDGRRDFRVFVESFAGDP